MLLRALAFLCSQSSDLSPDEASGLLSTPSPRVPVGASPGLRAETLSGTHLTSARRSSSQKTPLRSYLPHGLLSPGLPGTKLSS